MKFLKCKKKLYTSYAKTALAAALFLLIAIPFMKNVSNDGKTYTQTSRFKVVLNGTELGYVSDVSIAENALLEVRNLLGSDNAGLTLIETDMKLYEDKEGGNVLSMEEITDSMYESLSEEVNDIENQVTAYTVRIDDFTVTLASIEDVEKLIQKVKNKYCKSDKFKVEITEDNTGAYRAYKVNFTEAENGSDKIVSINFVENVEIIETKQKASNVVKINDAYELITKEHMEKGTYTVVSGDCLSSIARNNNLTLDELLALNYGFTIDTAIYEGDVLIVTVPATELSVEVVEEKEYDEEYNAPVQYIDNNTMYIGNEIVIQEGMAGKRHVVANVTYVNGTEKEREILDEMVSVESVPKIIERGTLTPPTYIKPVYSDYVTCPWGYRTSPVVGFHNGVDWYVPSGTPVRASSTGVVTLAGWYGNYGYCVDITHSDGSFTRYAHLSGIAVAYGQTILQNQVLGYSGNTGLSFGPHLHFEIRIGGQSVNPLLYVK